MVALNRRSFEIEPMSHCCGAAPPWRNRQVIWSCGNLLSEFDEKALNAHGTSRSSRRCHV